MSSPHLFTPQPSSAQTQTPANWQSVPGPGGGFEDFQAPVYAAGGAFNGPNQGSVPGGDSGTGINSFFYGASSGFIRSGLGAYGERVLGSGRNFVESNVNRYLSTQSLQYYFQVNDGYVRNKIKMILLPFLHRGHWTRIAEQVPGGLTYRPARHDINAPDLYIPSMAVVTYVVLGAFALGLQKRFSPTVVSARFTRALIGWIVETALLRFLLYSLGSTDVPILDLVSYAGYIYVSICASLLMWMCWQPSYYAVVTILSLCLGFFLVKTMKRVLFSESRSYTQETSMHHYSLILLAASQLPLSLWLGVL